jgi:hypothetical protein
MINKAGNLRRGMMGTVQVIRLDPAFALPTKPRGRWHGDTSFQLKKIGKKLGKRMIKIKIM